MVKFTLLLSTAMPLACWSFAPRIPLQLNKHAAAASTNNNRILFSTPTSSSDSTTNSNNIDDAISKAFEDDANDHFLGKAIPYEELTIGVLKETMDGETRVSQTPDSVANLVKAGFHVMVEAGGMFVVVLRRTCATLFV